MNEQVEIPEIDPASADFLRSLHGRVATLLIDVEACIIDAEMQNKVGHMSSAAVLGPEHPTTLERLRKRDAAHATYYKFRGVKQELVMLVQAANQMCDARVRVRVPDDREFQYAAGMLAEAVHELDKRMVLNAEAK